MKIEPRDVILWSVFDDEPNLVVNKASFGGDRSAAGRYAAEQRWKGHQKKDDKPTGGRTTDQKLAEGPTNLLFGRDANGMPVMGSVKELKTRYGKSAEAREEYFRTRYGVKLKIKPAKAGSVAEAVQMGVLQALEEICLSTNLDNEILRGVSVGDTGSDPHYEKEANGWYNNGYVTVKPETIEKRLGDLLSKLYGTQTSRGVGLKPSTKEDEDWYGDEATSNIPLYSTSQMLPSIPAVAQDLKPYFSTDPTKQPASRKDLYSQMAQRAGYAVMVHEFGHAVDFGASTQGESVSTQAGEEWDKLRAPTRYGQSNPYEKAAESFAAWWLFGGGQGNLPKGIAGIGRLADPILRPILEARGDLVKNATPPIDIATLPLDHPVIQFILAPLLNLVLRKARVKVDAMVAAALAKASFGGDRSAAGRYAAEQRWKGHQKKDKTSGRVVADEKAFGPLGLNDSQSQVAASGEDFTVKLAKQLADTFSFVELTEAVLVQRTLGDILDSVQTVNLFRAYRRELADAKTGADVFKILDGISAAENAKPRLFGSWQQERLELIRLSGAIGQDTDDALTQADILVHGFKRGWTAGSGEAKGMVTALAREALGASSNRSESAEYERKHDKEYMAVLKDSPAAKKVLTALVKEIYADTQRILKESLPQGTTHVRLFRGTALTAQQLQAAKDGSLDVSTVSSWTMDSRIAPQFRASDKQNTVGGRERLTVGVLTGIVPIASVFALSRQGFGTTAEAEVVVLGPSVEIEKVETDLEKARVKVDAMIAAAFVKASFGGDRSAAGRYAAEQRWKGHVKREKMPKPSGFIGTTKPWGSDKPYPSHITGQDLGMMISDDLVEMHNQQDAHKTHRWSRVVEGDPTSNANRRMAKNTLVTNLAKALVAQLPPEVILQALNEIDRRPDEPPIKPITAADLRKPPLAEKNIENEAYELVNLLIGQWAQSSNDSLRLSLAIQQVVAREFGLTKAAPASVVGDADLEQEKRAKSLSDPRSAAGKVIAAVVRQQYADTQAYFAAKGITEITLHRGKDDPNLGTRLQELEPEGTFPGEGKKTFTTEVALRPLSSFSADYETANQFARRNAPKADAVRITVRIPVSQVFSTPFTGIGCLSEYEFVVLGEPTVATVRRPNMESGNDL